MSFSAGRFPSSSFEEIKGTPVTFGEPLAGHTSLRIGGRAEIFARPSGAESLSRLLESNAGGLPVFLMGGGTNLLVPDGDIKALVISAGAMRGLELREGREGGMVVSAAAGEPLKRVLAFCLQNGLSGLEPLAGIPGSIGGAVAGNAGAHGRQIGGLVQSVTVVDLAGQVKKVSGQELGFRYRGSFTDKSKKFIASVELRLEKGDPGKIRELFGRNFELKKKTQPLAARSAGCVFKNPEGISAPAGRLIEEAGLKGAHVGDIQVSRVHANFFINTGKGTAADFTGLMDKVREGVLERSGISLEPEIRIMA